MKFLPIVFMMVILSCGTSQIGKSTQGGDTNLKSNGSTSDNSLAIEANTKTNSAISSNSTATDANPAPTQRTVDLGTNQPWEYFGSKTIKKKVDQGEVIFLWSDVTAMEKETEQTINFKPSQKYLEAENAKPADVRTKEVQQSWNNYIQAFVYEMQKENIGHQKYLDALTATGNDLASGKLDTAQTALDKAIQIRTGQ